MSNNFTADDFFKIYNELLDLPELDFIIPQAIDPSKTSINHIPSLFKKMDKKANTCNLDIGGGKYNTGTEYLSRYGVSNWICDPYCKSELFNQQVLRSKNYHSSTLSNVLNVIQSKEERINVLHIAQRCIKKNGKIYICVYEGDNE